MAGIVSMYGLNGQTKDWKSNLGTDPDGYINFQFLNKDSRLSIGWEPNIDPFYHGKAPQRNVKTLNW